MLSQQLQAASTLGLLQMGQIICHVRVNHIAIQKMLKEVYACSMFDRYTIYSRQKLKSNNQGRRYRVCVCGGGV
jgi:hypothetical protein